MNPLKLTFTANEQTLTKTDNFTDFASNTVSYIEATFTLGENWTGYDSVRAVWKTDYYTISTVLDANFTCVVPTEVLRYKAKVFVNLVGSIVENDTLTDRLTTFPVLALTVRANAAVNGSETAPVTPSQFEQFVDTVRNEAESISDYSYDSEAWAVGTRGGVDVPSTDPTYHNNSKYWAEQNAGLAGDVADLEDDVADLKSELNSVAEVTVTESSETVTEDILSDITWTEGYYIGKNGVAYPVSTLKYSNKIRVSEGDVLSIVPTNSAFRYVCAYSDNVAVEAKGAESVNTYTVPSGVDEVVLTAYVSASYAPTKVNHTYTQITYKNILDDDISAINDEIDSIESVITTESYIGYLNNDIAPTFTTGAISANGTSYPSYTSFQYTQKLSVSEGDTIQALSSGVPYGMRFICAYNGTSVVSDAGSDDELLTYTVPNGVDGVVVTTRIEANVDIIHIMKETALTASYVKPVPMGYMMEKGSLANGESMTLPYHNVKINNCYIFNANIDSFNSITFRKQTDTYVTVNSTNLIIHNDQTEITVPHGLTFGHNIGLLVENETSYTLSKIKIFSDGDIFEYSTATRFLMDSGVPTILSTGSTLTDCTFSWVSKNVNCPIWMFGDSYFSWYPQRWTYYLAEDGYTKDAMLNGYAGQASNTAYASLVNLLAITTPKIVVWCLGMNDEDGDSAVSESWNTYYLKVIELQKKYGFELILYTVPTTPTMNNNFKNAIIRSSGYRYIEADKAVRINNSGDWVTGALESDQVHPTDVGAKILYSRVLSDLPEIMCN